MVNIGTSSQNIRRTVLLLAIVLSADLGSTFHNHFRGFPRISSALIDTLRESHCP